MSPRTVDALLGPEVAIPIFLVKDATIATWNEAARALLGGKLGQSIAVPFQAASASKLFDSLGDGPRSCEVQIRANGKEAVPAKLVVVPLEKGEHIVIVARTGPEYSDPMAKQLLEANDRLTNLTRDLSKQAAELEAARKRFESLAELREHFVSMLAHDVRGALNVILLGVETIDGTKAGSTEIVGATLGRMRRAALRIQELAEKVLEAARTESGRMVIDARPVLLRAVARDAMEIYRPLADAQGVALTMVERGPQKTLLGDRIRLSQVVGNLIENAIRHSPRGGEISIEAESSERCVRLVVRDEGPGIPEVLRDRLFDRFVQGPGGTGSLGLGLYVARQLVNLHHGRIFVEDAVPHGAAFVIELPVPDEPVVAGASAIA